MFVRNYRRGEEWPFELIIEEGMLYASSRREKEVYLPPLPRLEILQFKATIGIYQGQFCRSRQM